MIADFYSVGRYRFIRELFSPIQKNRSKERFLKNAILIHANLIDTGFQVNTGICRECTNTNVPSSGGWTANRAAFVVAV